MVECGSYESRKEIKIAQSREFEPPSEHYIKARLTQLVECGSYESRKEIKTAQSREFNPPSEHYVIEINLATMPERSKGVDLSSTVFALVGSNPTRSNAMMPERSKGEHLRCSVFALVGSNPTHSINFIVRSYGVEVTPWTLNPLPRVRSPVGPII